MKPILLILFLMLNCSAREEEPEKSIGQEEEKILIVYLSRTNNTEAIAHMIQKEVGGKMVELELKEPYPANYREIVEQVDQENESGYLPPLKTEIDSLEKYDLVFLGFPTWDMQLPPPMKSFLTRNDLSGKTLVPFNTNGGYGVGSSFETIEDLCPDSTILKGFSIKGGSERDGKLLVIKGEKAKEAERKVRQWLRAIGILK